MDRECSPDVLALFMQEVIVEYNSYRKLVRRSEPREPVAIPVLARPVDADLNSAGDPFHAVTRDISHGGVGLFHTRPIDCGWLELTFSSPHSGKEMTILATVEHCTPCGRYFILGCRFVRKRTTLIPMISNRDDLA